MATLLLLYVFGYLCILKRSFHVISRCNCLTEISLQHLVIGYEHTAVTACPVTTSRDLRLYFAICLPQLDVGAMLKLVNQFGICKPF